MNLTELYATCDPAGWDACRSRGEQFDGGSFSRPSTMEPDFEIALAVLSGEPVSIVEAVSAVDIVEHALDTLSKSYESADLELPRYGPSRYLSGAAARQRKARDKRTKVA